MNEPCPRPTRRRYPDEQTARAALSDIRKHYRSDAPLFNPYRCACGSWHLTTRIRWNKQDSEDQTNE